MATVSISASLDRSTIASGRRVAATLTIKDTSGQNSTIASLACVVLQGSVATSNPTPFNGQTIPANGTLTLVDFFVPNNNGPAKACKVQWVLVTSDGRTVASGVMIATTHDPRLYVAPGSLVPAGSAQPAEVQSQMDSAESNLATEIALPVI